MGSGKGKARRANTFNPFAYIREQRAEIAAIEKETVEIEEAAALYVAETEGETVEIEEESAARVAEIEAETTVVLAETIVIEAEIDMIKDESARLRASADQRRAAEDAGR